MIRSTTLRLSTTLMVSASALSLAAPAMAQEMLFASHGDAEVRTGLRQTQTQGLTQIRLPNGATVSILDRADYRINADGTVDLYGGSITVAGGNGMVIVRMPEGMTGEVEGEGSAASFSVADNGEGRGHILTGTARLGRGDAMRRFTAGEMFAFAPGERVRQVVSNGAQSTPDGDAEEPQVADLGDGGPVAAAQNGLPVTLGDALAAAGASSDIVEAARRVDASLANPSAKTFPSGDLGLLIAGAAGLENAYGGTPFTGAQADIIRTNLAFLANGGAGSQFLASYAGFLGDYLDLIRSGAAPSGFDAASLAEINSFITYRGRTTGFAALVEQDRVLAEAYLAFLLGGGNPDLFAGTFTDLTTAYFAFVRGGGNPADFTGGSQATLDDYIAFLADSGLVQQLSAENQALVAAYLANGGLAFAGQYQAALGAYSDYLASGGLPSAYGALDQATLRAYLETLAETGLLAAITGARADFYADYLAFLRAGGDVDGFAGLPVNIFTGYAGELDAYFAFLAAGNLPSDYTGGDIAQLQAFVSQLQAAGALDAFLGNQASFFAAFNAFLAGGGDFDAFGQLNANIFAGYAVSLDAYFAFLNGGGLPSAYTAEQLDVLNAYLAQLAAAGALDRFLGGQADFFADYLAFLQSGGQIDSFALLNANIFAGYASALSAYFDYLANGGVPSAYGVLTQEVIADYLAALAGVGATDAFLADLAAFYTDYFAFILGGGNPDNFAGLPVPPDFPAFASALNAYALFLSGGGLPSDYTAEELAVLQQYLDTIINSGQLASLLGGNADLLTAYFAFIANGGDLDGFTGLPVYADYVSALNAYYAFLASGGLPGDYTVLTQAQIEAYLAALNGAGGLRAYGDLNAFFTAYFAFVSGGGDPLQFAGLPVYADYVSALNAYYAFLAGGGLPSDYTVLTQAQIEAYLAALSGAQGGFGAFGDLNGFFASYFAFVIGGGDPDQFAGLPDLIGIPLRLTGYTGGFSPAQANINIALAATTPNGVFAGGESGFTTDNFTLDENGGLTSYVRQPGGQSRTNGNTQTVDIFGNEDVIIGRWINGTVAIPNSFTFNQNQGLHYMLAHQPSVPFFAPTSGRIDYYLTAATRPTIADGSLAPGVFDARLAILFGTEALLGLEGSVTMPTSGADLVHAFSTTGGVTEIEQSNVTINVSEGGSFSAYIPGLVGNGCDPELCGFGFFASFAGDGEDTIGATYNVYTGIRGGNIVGAAIFETGRSRVDNGGGTDTGETPISGTYAGGFIGGEIFTRVANVGGGLFPGGDLISLEINTFTSDASINASGVVQSFSLGLPVERQTAQTYDAFGDSDILIGRWSEGTFLLGTNEIGLSANQGFHYLFGRPLDSDFDLLAKDSIRYTLEAATMPTILDGSLAPGVFSGEIAINFNTNALRLGIDAQAVFQTSGEDWIVRLQTPGGLDNIEGYLGAEGNNAVVQSGIFNINAPIGSDNLGVCPATGCMAFINGQFSSESTDRLGLTYSVGPTYGDAQSINGAAIFRNAELGGGTGTGGGSGGTGTGFTGTRDNIVYYTYTNGSLASGFGGSANFVDGEVTGVSSIIGTVVAGSASIVEATDLETISWARWTDGTVETRGLLGNVDTVVGANGGYHVLLGETTTALPASGTIRYDQIGGTAATDNQGSTPGTVTGQLAIAFGTVSRVGYNFSMNVGGRSWAVATNGGAANPEASDINLVVGSGIWTFGGTYSSTNNTVTATGGACAASCIVSINGTMFGADASHAGVAMNVTDVTATNTVQASGLAIFGAQSSYTYNPYAGIQPSTAPIAIAPSTEGNWERWSLPVSGQAITPVSLGGDLGGIPPGQRHPSAADAERLLGGMITFPEAR